MSRADLAQLSECALLREQAAAHRRLADIAEAMASRRAREQASGEDRFTSLDLPKHTTLRTFREVVKASGLGEKSGQVWSIAKSDWYSLRRAPSSRKVTPTSVTPANDTAPACDERSADQMLMAAGMRPTRGGTP